MLHRPAARLTSGLALPLAAAALFLQACDGKEPAAPNVGPRASIASPADGSAHEAGAAVAFTGTASDPEDGALTGGSLAWSSSLDGALGTGGSLTRSDLSAGSHTITLTATDSDGATGSATRQVVVHEPPTAAITAPAPGSVHAVGAEIVFEGTADDAEDGPLAGGALAWSSDLDGDLGTGSPLAVSGLSRGAHMVTLTASDSHGSTASATVEIVLNAAPIAEIGSPGSGSSHAAGEEVVFEGSATDAEDGVLTGDALAWHSSLDGALGTGVSLARSDLTDGTHTVTLTATDSRAATGSASIEVIVEPPLLEIGEPVTGLSAAESTTRRFVLELPESGDAVSTDGSAGAARAAGAAFLRIAIDGGTGDADLYVRHGAWPTVELFDCRPLEEGNDEVCDFDAPAAGSWYVLVHAVEAYSGVTLSASDVSCPMDGPDSDGDRLPDCAETGTGVYVSAFDTGTDPHDPDTDGDGISDGDEVLGTAGGLDLPAMGVSPLRRDILLEYDWFDDANEDCAFHSHRPTGAAVAAVTAMFAGAPVQNPDGTTGINVIHDYGQGGVFTGGNLVADADGVLAGGVNHSEFQSYKAANFAPERHGYFHYVLMPHRYNETSSSSGQAELFGDDLIVSLQCFLSTRNVSHTIAHELGHNLGLLHGGDDDRNWKPNYNSVMNYKYQFPGIDSDCTPPGNGVLDFSRGTRPSLDENDLSEPAGVCGLGAGVPWDWNGDGDTTDEGLAFDINVDNQDEGDGFFSVLDDHDDWGAVYLLGIGDSDGFPALREVRIESCQNTPMPMGSGGGT